MAGKIALVDYHKCDPGGCERGVCAAALVCPQRSLVQEEPYEVPMAGPFPCKGCGDCARTCTAGAIRVVMMG